MKKSVIIYSIVFIMFLLPVAYGASAFGADGAAGTESIHSNPESAANIENWPQKAQDMCKKAQDNALARCAEHGAQYSPGGWWVQRMISARGNYKEQDISVSIHDIIVGKWDCPPHDLIVDEDGNFIVQSAIYSEFVSYINSMKKTGENIPEDEQSVDVVCSFSCSAWPCPENYDKNTNCIDTYFEDEDGDGRDDMDRRTKEQIVNRLIEGTPDAAGEYYYGIRLMCEGEEEIPWYQFWKSKKCKLKDCITSEIPLADDPSRTIIRVCCGCSCEHYKLDTSFSPDDYDALDYDPFEQIFAPKTIDQVLEEQRRNVEGFVPLLPNTLISDLIREDTKALTSVDGIDVFHTPIGSGGVSPEDGTPGDGTFELMPGDVCRKLDASNTVVAAGDDVTQEDVEDVWKKIVALEGVVIDSALEQRAEDSDKSVTLDDGDSVTLNVNNFPILEDAGLNEVTFIPVLGEDDMITITYLDSEGKTSSKQVRDGEKAEFNILDSDDFNLRIDVELSEKVADLTSEDVTSSVRFRVKGDKVLLDDGDAEDIVVAENHGGFVGSNLMVTEALGSPGSGSTASVPSEYSSTGAAVQIDVGEGLNWYYVKGVESPTETGESYGDQPVGILTLEDIESGDSKTLIWYQDGSFPNGGSYGHVIPIGGGSDTSRVVVYDWGSSSSPDGISLGSSTSKVKYKLVTVGVEFTVETDWGTYTKFRFGGDSLIELVPDGTGVELSVSGGNTFEDDGKNFKISGDSRMLTIEEISEAMGPLQVELDIEAEVETEEAEVPEMPSSALIEKSQVAEHMANADNIIMIGEMAFDGNILQSCGELVAPEGFGVTSYNVETVVANGDNPEQPCPLVNGCNPQVVMVETPGSVTVPEEDEEVLMCVDNVCTRAPRSQLYAEPYNSIGGCFDLSEGDYCGKRRVACVNKACKVVPVYTIRNPGDDEGCGESNVGASCCNPPDPDIGDCRTTWCPPSEREVEVETDRDWGSLTCSYEVYQWRCCNVYNSETCEYNGGKERRRELIDQGTYSGWAGFINCGSRAYVDYTTPYGIAGVKG